MAANKIEKGDIPAIGPAAIFPEYKPPHPPPGSL
jgi:hypothetical protein